MLGLRNSIEAAQTPEELAAAIAQVDPGSRWTVSSLAEVAQFFQMAVSSIKGWSQEGMPNAGNGWSLPAIVRWRIARLSGDDLSTARKRQEIELNAIAIDSRRMELEQQRGELVELASVELTFAQALIKCRCQIMTLVESIATSAPPELRDQLRAEVDRTCRAALKTLRRDLESPVLVDDEGNELAKEESTDEQDT